MAIYYFRKYWDSDLRKIVKKNIAKFSRRHLINSFDVWLISGLTVRYLRLCLRETQPWLLRNDGQLRIAYVCSFKGLMIWWHNHLLFQDVYNNPYLPFLPHTSEELLKSSFFVHLGNLSIRNMSRDRISRSVGYKNVWYPISPEKEIVLWFSSD